MQTLPNKTVFYTIERSIKEYRKFAQHKINKKFKNITVDQALILLFINDQPELSQTEIGSIIFKDNASVTRMIELLIKNNYLERTININDRRKYTLTPSKKGSLVQTELQSIVLNNRQTALAGVSENEIKQLIGILNKIIANCKQ